MALQFINVDNSYYKTFNYNNVNNLYLTNQIKSFIKNESSIYNNITDENLFVDITNCDASYFTEYMYCKNLIKSIGAKRVIITHHDTTKLYNNIANYDFSENMKNYIKNSKSKEEGYRVIVEFNDDTIASLKMN